MLKWRALVGILEQTRRKYANYRRCKLAELISTLQSVMERRCSSMRLLTVVVACNLWDFSTTFLLWKHSSALLLLYRYRVTSDVYGSTIRGLILVIIAGRLSYWNRIWIWHFTFSASLLTWEQRKPRAKELIRWRVISQHHFHSSHRAEPAIDKRHLIKAI